MPCEFHFILFNTLPADVINSMRPRKSCYIGRDRVRPRESRLKREVRSKRRQSSHVTSTCLPVRACVRMRIQTRVHRVIPCTVYMSIRVLTCPLRESSCTYVRLRSCDSGGIRVSRYVMGCTRFSVSFFLYLRYVTAECPLPECGSRNSSPR